MKSVVSNDLFVEMQEKGSEAYIKAYKAIIGQLMDRLAGFGVFPEHLYEEVDMHAYRDVYTHRLRLREGNYLVGWWRIDHEVDYDEHGHPKVIRLVGVGGAIEERYWEEIGDGRGVGTGE